MRGELVTFSRNNSGLDARGERTFRSDAGLFVRRAGRVILKHRCVTSRDPQPDVNNGADGHVDLRTAARFMPEGAFVQVDH